MGLKEKAISGVKWNSVATIICTILQVIRLAILTYLLDKSDFGLIAIAMMVISFTDIFSDLGITVALIHKQDITDKQYSSVYWLNVAMSVLIAVVVCAVSPLVAEFYNQPLLVPIICLLSLQILFNGFGKMFHTIKTKQLEFNFISKVRILATFLGFVLTIVLAFLGWGVFSLVVGQVFQIGLTQLIFSLSGIREQKILFYFSLKEIKDIFKIGSWQLAAQILDFISSKIDIMIIGRFFSMDDLGVYNIAKELIIRPFLIINGISASVFSAVFAKVQDDISVIKANFAKLVRVISLICTPIYIGMFVFADFIVAILYSPDFSEVAIFIRILALTGIASAITSQGGVLQVALGRTDLGFRWTIVRIILSTLVLFITCFYGIYAVAYGQLFLGGISLFIFFYLIIKPILQDVTLNFYLDLFKKTFVLACIEAIPLFIILYFISNSWIVSVLCIVIFVINYLFTVKKIYPEIYNEVSSRLMKRKSY